MIPPTSPGADSTAAVELERTLRLYATDGPAAVYVADPRVRRIVPADVLADAADEIEALLAALLRSQQEREALATALREIDACQREVMYQRCPDCDSERKCGQARACVLIEQQGGDPIQRIARRVLSLLGEKEVRNASAD